MKPSEIIAAREPVHGRYTDVANKAQLLKQALFHNCESLNCVQRESIELIATKLARICCGDPNYRDHWVDIAGYATLVLDRLPQEKT